MRQELGSELRDAAEAIVASYGRNERVVKIHGTDLPNTDKVATISTDLLRILFPGYFVPHGADRDEIANHLAEAIQSAALRLEEQILKALECAKTGESEEACCAKAHVATVHLFGQIPAVREILMEDIQAAYDGDPAATSYEEIILAYPCLVAISLYRLAHILYMLKVPLVPRMMTEYAHSRTGIDIHPGARIGYRFFIDHGTGVVIGETTEIGNNVKIYQGVTLGAKSFPKDEWGRAVKGIKRHPRIEDNVTIYSGATILGGDVVIGNGSVIGGNVWLTHSVPPRTTVLISVPQEIRLEEGIEDYRI
jgi:serine O-acetyltransferase